ncbi:TadE-like protein [Rubripirellula tenax]|uniref:TadE-like protein n=1 Tax=Rubripirellula tenax TaxID=2528015 RepID=A0A5C6E9D2_9BACT|nr:TadE/TadG family type IV pilus assembly protein [Rubripirellula tenax]TWU44527.1 TadE-like protein [Rubripirellula tenax]
MSHIPSSPIVQRRRRFSTKRRGVAAVEFAVCLPVLVLLVFGSIEAASFIFLKQSLNVAAYEAIRESIRVGSDNAAGENRAINILSARNVNDFVVSFPNGEALDADRGDEVVVEVSAPTSTNSPLAGQFVANRVLTARIVMVKE